MGKWINISRCLVVATFLCLTGCCQRLTPAIGSDVDERFMYKGEVIHPCCLYELFDSSGSKHLPSIAAVDLEGCQQGAKAHPAPTVSRLGTVKWRYGDEGSGACYVKYSHEGMLANGIHVLYIEDYRGGQGEGSVDMGLLFVRVAEDIVIDCDKPLKEARKRTQLIGVGYRSMDCSEFPITLRGNRVILGKEGRITLDLSGDNRS